MVEATNPRPYIQGSVNDADPNNKPVLQHEEALVQPISGIELTDAESKVIQPHFCMMICGKPGSGKTTLVKKLVENQQLYQGKFDRIMVISPSIGKMGFTVPTEFANNEFDLEWIFNHIHDFNLRQEQFLMEYLRSEDANTIVQSNINKRKLQELLQETIQSQRILDLPKLQRLLMNFNSRFTTLGGKVGPILGRHNLPKPKGCVDFSLVPGCFMDSVPQQGLPQTGNQQSLLRKQMLQGLITRRQMMNAISDRVNEIQEYANQVQTLYLNLIADPEVLRATHLNVLLVLDDVAGDIKQNEYDPSLIKLFFNRRHLIANGTISLIVVTQKFTAIPQKIRTTSSWIILFRLNPIETETVWKDAVVLSKHKWTLLLERVFGTEHFALGQSLTSHQDRRYENLGIWTEFPDVFFENFKLIQ